MFENLKNIFKKSKKKELLGSSSKDAAKERLHLVLMQDRANVSADFLDLMRKEIVDVIKKYIDIDEAAMDVRLTTETNEDGTQGAPALYANIPILNIKEETRKLSKINKGETTSEILDNKEGVIEEKIGKNENNIQEESKNDNKVEDSTSEENKIVEEIEDNALKENENQEELKEINNDKNEEDNKDNNITETEKEENNFTETINTEENSNNEEINCENKEGKNNNNNIENVKTKNKKNKKEKNKKKKR